MRKGVSQIISSVLLLALTVSIAGIYSQWAPEFSSSTGKEVANQADNNLKCNNAAFGISEAEYDITGQLLKLQISNRGTINFNNDITVSSVKSSRIIKQKTIGSLGVDESRLVEIKSEEAPELIVITSQECPDLERIEENIDVSR